MIIKMFLSCGRYNSANSCTYTSHEHRRISSQFELRREVRGGLSHSANHGHGETRRARTPAWQRRSHTDVGQTLCSGSSRPQERKARPMVQGGV